MSLRGERIGVDAPFVLQNTDREDTGDIRGSAEDTENILGALEKVWGSLWIR